MLGKLLVIACVMRNVRLEIDCKGTARGLDYRGQVSQTINGTICQHWNVQDPHAHEIVFSEGSSFHENFCRNPDYSETGPWCFTTDPDVPREYCDIPLCPNPQPIGSWLFDAEHGGLDLSSSDENYVTMKNLSYGSGIKDEPQGAVMLPAASPQTMYISNPTRALEFKTAMSFVTYVYHVGKIGPFIEINFSNGSTTNWLAFWVRHQPFDMSMSVYHSEAQPIHENVISNSLNNNSWHKVGFSMSNTELNVYINDSQVLHYEYDFKLDAFTRSGNIYFGRLGNNYLGGRMACAKLFDVALTEQQIKRVQCTERACKDTINDRCVGRCIGFYVGKKCGTYILPIAIDRESVSLEMLDSDTSVVKWKVLRAPKSGTKHLYYIILEYKTEGTNDIINTKPIYFSGEDVLSHTYSCVIHNLRRDTNIEVFIKSVRVVGDYKSYHGSVHVTLKIPCVEPDVPKGLFVKKLDTEFVVTWTSDLTQLDSGCSSKRIFIYHKYTESGPWIVNEIKAALDSYSIPGHAYDKCYIQIAIVNNEGLEASTVVISDQNATRSPDVGTTTMMTISPEISTTEYPYDESRSESDFDEKPSQIVLILAACLALVGVLLVIAIIIIIVCWRRLKQIARDNTKTQSVHPGNMNVSEMSYAGKHTQYEQENDPYMEPVSAPDNTYQEIEPNQTRGDRPYASLDETRNA